MNRSKIESLISMAESALADNFSNFDRIREANQLKVMSAMREEKLSNTDFHWSTGYGYGDSGRGKVERIFSRVFKTEDSLVRPSIASGTHALSLTLQGMLLPGDTMLSISGKPYDTLQKVIGIAGDEPGNLMEYGINYKDVELKSGTFDYKSIEAALDSNVKLILIQRSSGYSIRPAHTITELSAIIKHIRTLSKNVIIMVDNCYGEFTCTHEPSELGADLTVGSLIKNPGGGIAISGGYIAGKSEYIERIANRLTAPGLGKDCGLSFGTTRSTLQGLFFAPMSVNNALKGALLFGYVFNELGYKVFPEVGKERSDIVQGIVFNNPDLVIEFCRGIQRASIIDSHVVPYPWDMPGYEDQVIMASGGFVDGSSIELSADGPLRSPYAVFYQGGISYDQCKYALYEVLKGMFERNMIC